MYKSKKKGCLILNKIRSLLKWLRKTISIIIIAHLLGFSNAYYNETRTIHDIKFEFKQEQVLEDDQED